MKYNRNLIKEIREEQARADRFYIHKGQELVADFALFEDVLEFIRSHLAQYMCVGNEQSMLFYNDIVDGPKFTMIKMPTISYD
jgi:hypothetical protein